MRRWLSMQDPAVYVALALLILSVGVAWRSVGLGLGEMRSPGAGFVFFWTAVFLGALALRMLVRALRVPSRATAPLWRGHAWSKVIGVVVALLAYAFFMERLGYIVTTGLFSIFLFALLADDRRRWWACLLGGVLTAVLTYLVFDRLFSVQLPPGPLGF